MLKRRGLRIFVCFKTYNKCYEKFTVSIIRKFEIKLKVTYKEEQKGLFREGQKLHWFYEKIMNFT